MSMRPVEAGQLWVSYGEKEVAFTLLIVEQVSSEDPINTDNNGERYWHCLERSSHDEIAREVWWSPGADSLYERIA